MSFQNKIIYVYNDFYKKMKGKLTLDLNMIKNLGLDLNLRAKQ